MQRLLKRFLDAQTGATAVEYAMLLALFAVAILGWAKTAGDDIDEEFVHASDVMDDAKDLGVDVPVTVKGGD